MFQVGHVNFQPHSMFLAGLLGAGSGSGRPQTGYKETDRNLACMTTRTPAKSEGESFGKGVFVLVPRSNKRETDAQLPSSDLAIFARRAGQPDRPSVQR